MYYWWATQTAVSADWDTIRVAWVVRDSLWNASFASAQRRKQLVGSWAEHTLEASSIDMSFAPPMIVVQLRNLSNSQWVLQLLLIAPTREYTSTLSGTEWLTGHTLLGQTKESWLLWI